MAGKVPEGYSSLPRDERLAIARRLAATLIQGHTSGIPET